MRRPATSIAVPLVAAITAIASLLMGVVGVLACGAIRTVLMTDLRHYGANLTVHVASALANPLRSNDSDQVERVLVSVMEFEAVNRISVQLVDSIVPDWVKQRSTEAAQGTAELVPSERRTILLNGTELGTVEIAFATRRVEEILDRYRWWMIGAAIVADVVLAVGLYLLLRSFVLRPLREIASFSGRRPGPEQGCDELHRRRYRGEAELLRGSLLAMVTQLEQRHAELLSASSRLETERGKLQAFFRLVPTGIAIVDAGVRVTETNPSMERIFGLSSADLEQGKHLWSEFYDRRGHALTRDELPSARAIQTRSEIIGEEIHVHRPDGTKFWISVSASPLPGYGAAIVVSDISARKEGDERMARQLDELGRWHKVTLGREARIRQLKEEINDLRRRLHEEPRFQLDPAPSDETSGEGRPS